MPKRTDIRKILLIGSGPIVIGQACEFDYSGTQACKALREEGFEVVLVNSNPATIMTDPEMADRTYIEPLTPEYVAKVIARERPDAMLPTVGGQTGLNLAVALAEDGTLDRYGLGHLMAAADGRRDHRPPAAGRGVGDDVAAVADGADHLGARSDDAVAEAIDEDGLRGGGDGGGSWHGGGHGQLLGRVGRARGYPDEPRVANTRRPRRRR